ncbi:lysylphosphatidylglycerol synthase transmembrane domain-containing protein [Achromobacter xylosoxidans]|uniref:lysylphosphatidylglycerol synthase transmembrane domain-containing protein n=1 Tax=Alcaligenes xylosoxydans xylosoxydans TaxID=85698 RepID=UPI0006C882A8|nr:lysylphosphatidylglycerol synthase transmembrane domain-containing protein [Achromobacter xylosoxidans]
MNSIHGPTAGTRRLRFVLKAAFAVVVCALLINLADPALLWRSMQRADGLYVLAGSAVFLGGQLAAAQRWRGILRAGGIDLGTRRVFALNLMGASAGTFLPGQGSGDLVKCTLLFPSYPTRRGFLIASCLMDRMAGLMGTLCLAAAGAILLRATQQDWTLGLYIVGGGAIMLLLLLAGHRYREHILASRLARNKISAAIISCVRELGRLAANPRLALSSLALSLLFQASWALSLWCMLRSVMPDAPLPAVMFAAPISILIATVPVSLGGLGVREGAFTLLMQRFDVPADLATVAALLSLLPIIITAATGAVLFALRFRVQAAATTPTAQVSCQQADKTPE